MTEKLEGANRRVRASIGERGAIRVFGIPVGLALAVLGAGLIFFGGDAPGSLVLPAEASHNTVTQAYLESLPNGSKVLLCHTEGNATQHSVESAVSSVINAGHFNASGSPLHAEGDVHDFIMTITIKGEQGEDDEVVVINDDACGPLATETPTNTPVPPTNTPTATATLPIATATQQVESTPTATPTNTTVPSTNTPTATSTQPIATSTQQVVASSTPTNTPQPTATRTTLVVPPTNTPVPLVAQVQSVQATPPPAVRALPSTGSGGYEDNSMTLLMGLALILTGSTIALAAMKRRAQ